MYPTAWTLIQICPVGERNSEASLDFIVILGLSPKDRFSKSVMEGDTTILQEQTNPPGYVRRGREEEREAR